MMPDAESSGESAQLAAFANLAERYCAVLDQAEESAGRSVLAAVHSILPSLYAAAMNLPQCPLWAGSDADDEDEEDGEDQEDEAAPEGAAWEDEDVEEFISSVQLEPDPDRLDSDQWLALFRRLGSCFRDQDPHRRIYDPYEAEEKEDGALLSDDLADIYLNLLSGLRKWRRGEKAEALVAWRCDFEIHWGAHAVGALAALQALSRADILPWPANGA